MNTKISLVKKYLSSNTSIYFDDDQINSIVDYLEVIVLWDEIKFNKKTLNLAEKELSASFGLEGDVDWGDLVLHYAEMSV